MADARIRQVLAALEKRKIKTVYAADAAEARKKVLDLIPPGSQVGIGGSVTIKELDVDKTLEEMGCEIHWHWRAKDKREFNPIRRRALLADVYLCSSNAITIDGRLVNIDGTGNRVAAMAFGPRQVIVVAGTNKLVDNLEEALDRIKTVACPQNARRQNRQTPCALTGKCNDCQSEERMCNVTTIIEGQPKGLDMYLVLVGEAMGF